MGNVSLCYMRFPPAKYCVGDQPRVGGRGGGGGDGGGGSPIYITGLFQLSSGFVQ